MFDVLGWWFAHAGNFIEGDDWCTSLSNGLVVLLPYFVFLQFFVILIFNL